MCRVIREHAPLGCRYDRLGPRATDGGNKDDCACHWEASVPVWGPHCQAGIGVYKSGFLVTNRIICWYPVAHGGGQGTDMSEPRRSASLAACNSSPQASAVRCMLACGRQRQCHGPGFNRSWRRSKDTRGYAIEHPATRGPDSRKFVNKESAPPLPESTPQLPGHFGLQSHTRIDPATARPFWPAVSYKWVLRTVPPQKPLRWTLYSVTVSTRCPAFQQCVLPRVLS